MLFISNEILEMVNYCRELHEIRKQNEILLKEIKNLKDEIDSPPASQIPHVSQDLLWEKADNIQL